MKRALVALSLAAAVTVSAEDAPADSKAVAAAKGAFAFDLLARLPAEGNLFFSPESISVALGMTALGAKGDTLAAFEKVLHIPKELGHDRFHAALGGHGQVEGKGFALRSANRLFGQKGHPFRAAFLDSAKRSYSGGLEPVDFKGDVAGARRTINEWVKKETREKIPELLREGSPTEASRLVLVNAVYFKATWAEPFEPRWTEDAPFFLGAKSGEKKTVKLMQKREHFRYAEDAAWQLVVLPYEGERFEAVVLLPKDGELALAARDFEALRARAAHENVHVWLPRFKFEWGQDLVPELRKLGLSPACEPTADFSGMVEPGSDPLFIGAVIHKAMVALDEHGTEAAAATAVDMRAGGVPAEPRKFRADRPFLFAIRDSATGSLLFLGRVADPTKP